MRSAAETRVRKPLNPAPPIQPKGKVNMRNLILSLIIAGAISAPAFAQRQTADDTKWITECVSDNKDEGQSAPVVLKYCTCMNNKMSNNETRSITQWEKANPNAQEACSREAGWGRR
jgi:hypothetical protein